MSRITRPGSNQAEKRSTITARDYTTAAGGAGPPRSKRWNVYIYTYIYIYICIYIYIYIYIYMHMFFSLSFFFFLCAKESKIPNRWSPFLYLVCSLCVFRGDRRSTCSLRLAIRNAWLLFYLCDCVVPRSVKSRGSRLRYSGWRRFSDPWNRCLIIASRTYRPRNICTYIRISRSEHVKINEYSHMYSVCTYGLSLPLSLSLFLSRCRPSVGCN